ncbi:MAG: hypothetical protein ACKV2T_11200 [Kofleriaceae bacterium]
MRLVVLIGVVACGDNAVVRDPDTAFSGSRLRVMHHVFDDGTRQLVTERLHDADRDEDCAATVWSDGLRYCTPASEPALFVDGNCEELVGRAPSGAAPAYFRREFVLRGTPLLSRLYPARERVTAPTLAWQLLDGQCIGPVDVDPNADYFALGPELTSDDFVQVTSIVAQTRSRLVYSLDTSDDGMQLPTPRMPFDSLLDVGCSPSAPDGATRAPCVPEIAVADYFRDDACTEPALAIRSGAVQPRFVQYPDASACPVYAHTGDAIVVPSPYRRTAAGCVAAIASSDERFYAIGAPLDLVQLERRHDVHPDRRMAPIRLVDTELGDDFRIEDVQLYDATLDIECALVATTDGDRCLPTPSPLAVEREPTYRDDQCSASLALVLVPATSCTLPTHLVDDTGPRPLLRYTGAIYHLSTGDRCLPYTVAGTAQTYELGPVVPLTTFAASTTVVD